MQLLASDINALFGSFLWPFLRIGATIGVAPVFGARAVPVRVRLGIALVLTSVVVPLLPSPPAVDMLSLGAVFVAAQQILIGLAMGFALLVAFAAFVLGGQIVAMQMGLGFASLVDPQNGIQTPMVSQLYVLLSTLIFLSFDGHLMLIETLVNSFYQLPVDMVGLGSNSMWHLVSLGSDVFSGAIMVALPAITTLLLINLAFGVVTRAAPQLNIFAVGFPVIIVSGLVVIMITLDNTAPRLWDLMEKAVAVMQDVLLGV
ncbi:MAG: flagellar biosynthetic protein FliR [Gammaproteobacteria bacterium]|nr:flagellar biosynthetic protein FliR [Gammaproteobacteria bacterium]